MPFIPPPRFEVDACWGEYEEGRPVWKPIYRGNNERDAINTADLYDYDSQIEVRFIDWELRPWREVLARKFDALENYIRNWGK